MYAAGAVIAIGVPEASIETGMAIVGAGALEAIDSSVTSAEGFDDVFGKYESTLGKDI